MTVCEILPDQITGFLLPLMGIVSLITGMVIGLGYMMGNLLNDQRIILWAKTEVFQLVISVASVILLVAVITSFCSITLVDIAALFPINFKANIEDISIYESAGAYFQTSSDYIHSTLKVARYHLGGYSILQMHSLWKCGNPEDWSDQGLSIFYCMFGTALGFGGGSGTSISPEAGYSIVASAVQISYNTLMFAYLSCVNYSFILGYVYRGFGFFLLPLGIFIRAMPFLRGLGSLLMTVSICFMIVYPLVLSIFYLDFLAVESVLTPEFSGDFLHYEGKSISGAVGTGDYFNIFQDYLSDNVFDANAGGVEFEIMIHTGNSFLIGVFIPTLALLATIGSIMYLNRYLGIEINLSRIVQMV